MNHLCPINSRIVSIPTVWIFQPLLWVPYRCVKCYGPCLAKDCQKHRRADPKRTDRDGNHTTNFTRYLSLLLKKEFQRPFRPNRTKFLLNSAFPNLPNKSAPALNKLLHLLLILLTPSSIHFSFQHLLCIQNL